MHKTLPYCIISIFLCAASSIEAAGPRDSLYWAMEAVACEREAFVCGDMYEANAAILRKAACCMRAGDYSSAAAALQRVQMYMLDAPDRARTIHLKEVCAFLTGDFDAARSYASEQPVLKGADTEDAAIVVLLEDMRAALADAPPYKSGNRAMALSFLPPLGQWYSGHYGEGLLSMGLNAAAAGLVAFGCIGGDWVTGLIGGGMALTYTFMGNVSSSAEMAGKHNAKLQEELRMRMVDMYRSLL